jgi:hypothetical protein
MAHGDRKWQVRRTDLGAFLVIGGIAAAISMPTSAATFAPGDRTFLYNRQGYLVTSIREVKGVFKETRVWDYPPGGSEECGVGLENGTIYVTLTHNTPGGAVPAGKGRWIVWSGRTKRGSVVQKSSSRWNILSARGTFLGHTRGPAGPEAGAAWLILGECE